MNLDVKTIQQIQAAGKAINGGGGNRFDKLLDGASVLMATGSTIPVVGELGAAGQAGIAGLRFANALAKGEGIGGATKAAAPDLAMAAADMIPGGGLTALAAKAGIRNIASHAANDATIPQACPKVQGNLALKAKGGRNA